MELRPLGATDLRVSVLGFGCASVGSGAGRGASERALHLALEEGVTLFDTADMYGVGASEEILGRVVAKRRDSVVIATKCGYAFSTRLKAIRWIKPLLRPLVRRLKGLKSSAAAVMASQRSQCFEPDYIEKCVHDSLRRLRTDRIDVFFLHDPPASIADRADVFEKLAALKRAGKVRHYGVSCDPDVAERVLKSRDTGVTAIQVNANLLDQTALSNVLALARAGGAGFFARQPLGHGRVLDAAPVQSALQSRALPADAPYVAGLALRFLRDTDGVSSVLAGMVSPDHVRANAAAMRGAPLTVDERAAAAALARPAAGGSVQG